MTIENLWGTEDGRIKVDRNGGNDGGMCHVAEVKKEERGYQCG